MPARSLLAPLLQPASRLHAATTCQQHTMEALMPPATCAWQDEMLELHEREEQASADERVLAEKEAHKELMRAAGLAGVETLLDDLTAAEPEWAKLAGVPGLLDPWSEVKEKVGVATEEFKVGLAGGLDGWMAVGLRGAPACTGSSWSAGVHAVRRYMSCVELCAMHVELCSPGTILLVVTSACWPCPCRWPCWRSTS